MKEFTLWESTEIQKLSASLITLIVSDVNWYLCTIKINALKHLRLIQIHQGYMGGIPSYF